MRLAVTVPYDVLLGMRDGPGFLAGYGPIPADLARRLASDATWRRLLTDPVSGTVLDVGRTRYRPPAGIADHVRLRDRWCVMPTCDATAATCDLDHTAEWDRDDGATAADNIGPRCRRDHLVKSSGRFTAHQPTPGTFEITTPLGRAYRTTPGVDRPYERFDTGARHEAARLLRSAGTDRPGGADPPGGTDPPGDPPF